MHDGSDGVYEVNFDNLRINLFDGSLHVSELQIQADSVRFNELAAQGEAAPVLVEGYIPEFEIMGIRYIPLINNEVIIGKIGIFRPQLDIGYHINLVDEEEDEVEFDYQNPGEMLPEMLEAFNLKRFAFSDADIIVRMKEGNKVQQTLEVDKLSFEIDNLYVDRETRPEPDRFFYSDNILLKLEGITQQLPGEPYRFHVGLIGFETATMELFGENISLTPLQEQLRRQPYEDPVASLTLPSFSIRGIDLHQYMTDSILHIAHINFSQPSLVVYLPGLDMAGGEEEPQEPMADPYQMISDFMTALRIDSLVIGNAIVDVYNVSSDTVKLAEISKLTFVVDDFILHEEADMYDPNRLFYAKNYALVAEGYSALLPDFGHSVYGRAFRFNTLDAGLSLSGLLVRPEAAAGTAEAPPVNMNIYLPHFSIRNVDLPAYFNQEALHIGSIYADKPSFRISNIDLEGEEETEEIDLQNLYAYIEDYLTALTIGNISLEHAQIELHGQGEEERNFFVSRNTSFWLKNFHLDREAQMSPGRFLFADDISFAMAGFSVEMPEMFYRLTGGEFRITTGGRSMVAQNIELEPVTSDLQKFEMEGPYIPYSASLPEMRITGIDFFNILINDRLQLNDIIIQNPHLVVFYDPEREQGTSGEDDAMMADEEELDLENLYALIEEDWKVLSFASFKIESASVEFMRFEDEPVNLLDVDDFSITVTNFHLDENARLEPGRVLYADNIDMVVKDFFMKTPDSLHVFQAAQFGLITSESLVYGVGISMEPREDQDFESAVAMNNGNNDSGQEEGDDPADFYRLSLPEFRITGIDFNKALVKRILEIDEINFQHPSATIITALYDITRETDEDMLMDPDEDERALNTDENDTDLDADEDGEVDMGDFELYPYISDYLETLRINRFVINGARGEMLGKKLNGDTLTMFSLGNLDFLLTGFQIDSTSNEMMEKPFFADDLHIDLSDIMLKTPDTMYIVSIHEVGISSIDSTIYVDSLKVTPRFGMFEFADMIGESTTRVELWNRTLTMTGVNLMGLLLGQRIEIARLEWDGLKVNAFSDERYPSPLEMEADDGEDVYIGMPHKYLRETPFYIHIDSVMITNGDILYSFLTEDLDYPVRIHLGDMDLQAYNITNDSIMLANDMATRIYFNADLLGSGLLKANFNLLPGDPDNRFTMHGSIDSLKFDRLTPILRKMVDVEISEGGGIHALEFSLFGDHDHTEGSVRVFFEGLELEFAEDPEATNMRNRIFSALEWIVNNFILYYENPERESPFVANISYDRGAGESFVEYVTGAITNGIITSLVAPLRVAANIRFPLLDRLFGVVPEEPEPEEDDEIMADP